MRQILTVLKKELKDTVRDRRTLIVSIVMPIVFMPLILIGSVKLQEAQIKSAEEQVSLVAINNKEAALTLVNYLRVQEKVEIKDLSGDYKELIDNGELHVYISIEDDFEEKIKTEEAAELRVFEKSTETKSNVAMNKIKALLTVFNQQLASEKLVSSGVNPGVLKSIDIKPEDIATEKEKGGFFLGLLLPMFLVMFTIIGGMYVAIDVSAGEKERKTLEALILTPLSRMKIVAGKFMAVATTSIVSVVLSISSLYAAFKFFPPDFGKQEGSLEFSLGGTTILIMLGIGIILSIMFAGLLLAVAIFAKSYKEAQNYIMPFYIGAILPIAILGNIPGFKPGLVFFFIPALNAVVLFKENLLGVFDPIHILVTVGSLTFFAFLSIYIASRIYSKESILFRD